MRILLLLLSLLVPATAQESLIREVFDTASDTHVEVTALFTQLPPSGYFPIRVKIANNLNRDHDVRLDFVATVGFQETLRCVSSFDFGAGAGKTITRDILVPLSPTAGPMADRVMLSVAMTGSLGQASDSMDSAWSLAQPAVLLSEALFTPNSSALDSSTSKYFGAPTSGGAAFAGKFDPQQLPDDWRAFSGFDVVMMSDTDWTACPPGSRNAILSWVRLGGMLHIFSEGQPTLASLALPENTGAGTIEFRPLQALNAMEAPQTVNRIQKLPIPPIRQSAQSDFKNNWPLQGHFGEQKFRYGLFVGVLVAFGILVGPVNLFVLAKAGRRHRLFITTPIISLAASALMIGLIVVQDGFGGYGMRRVLMIVNPEQAAAYVQQEQISRTGVLLGKQMEIETPAVLRQLPMASSRWARFTDESAKGSYNLQPGSGRLAATGDWFQSRSEQAQQITAVVATRGRIERTGTEGEFLSTFDFPIRELFYLDENSNWSRATQVQTGEKFTLLPAENDLTVQKIRAQVSAFSARNRDLFSGMIGRQGHFIALTDQAPAIDTLAAIRWKETQTVITGPVVTP